MVSCYSCCMCYDSVVHCDDCKRDYCTSCHRKHTIRGKHQTPDLDDDARLYPSLCESSPDFRKVSELDDV